MGFPLIIRAPLERIESLIAEEGYGEAYEEEHFDFWELAKGSVKSSLRVYTMYEYLGEDAGGGGVDLPDLLIAFSSGAFGVGITAFYQVLIKYLGRYEARELTIERGDTKISLKGRSLPEEKAFVKMLFPELIDGSEPDSTTSEYKVDKAL
jgi:hypothetical protein